MIRMFIAAWIVIFMGIGAAANVTIKSVWPEAKQLRTWKQMCRGPARYDAMREAYDKGRPDPCNGAKEWRR